MNSRKWLGHLALNLKLSQLWIPTQHRSSRSDLIIKYEQKNYQFGRAKCAVPKLRKTGWDFWNELDTP